MNRTLIYSLCAITAIFVTTVASRSASSAGQGTAIVRLQSSTPGAAQSGHANLTGTVIAGQFQGGGAGLTSLNAGNLASGTLLDARLSANVTLLNGVQTISGAKTFSGAPSFTAAGTPFMVTGTTVVTNLNADLLDGQHGAFYQSAANLSGTLPDARLSTNVALLGTTQTFSALKIFGSSFQIPSGGGAGKFLMSDAVGVGSWSVLPPPSGTAGGDLGGTYPNPLVDGLQGRAVAVTAPTTGQVLGWNGSTWTPTSDSLTLPFNAPASLSGASLINIANLSATPLSSVATFQGYGTSGAALVVQSISGSGPTYGVYGESMSTDGKGVYGWASAVSGITYGVRGEASSPTGRGVYGRSPAEAVYGSSNGNTTSSYGIYGINTVTGNSGAIGGINGGASGLALGAGTGVLGTSVSGKGVWGTSTSGNGGTFSSTTGIGISATSAGNDAITATTSGGTSSGIFALNTGGGYGGFFKSSGTGIYSENTDPNNGVGGRFVSQAGGGYGIFAEARSTSGFNYGAYATSASPSGMGGYFAGGTGVSGYGTIVGGTFETSSQSGYGVKGLATADTGTNYGVFGTSASPAGYAGYFQGRGYFSGKVGIGVASPSNTLEIQGSIGALYGMSVTANGTGADGAGLFQSDGGYGIYVQNTRAFGVAGRFESTGSSGQAVNAYADLSGFAGWFEGRSYFSNKVGIGTASPSELLELRGGGGPTSLLFAPGKWYGTNTANKAQIDIPGTGDLLFWDNVHVNNTLTAGSKLFEIDHPLDPLNKFLRHGCIESDELKNLYDGTVTTDAKGYATVTVPDWFTALNEKFRYQVTVIDAGNDDDFVMAKITRELEDQSFTLRTSKAHTKVSWQITGVRKDAFAKANPLIVEEEKPKAMRGKYIHPEAFAKQTP